MSLNSNNIQNQNKYISKFTKQDVKNFLKNLGISKLTIEKFEKFNIDGNDIIKINEKMLKNLSIDNIHEQNLILNNVYSNIIDMLKINFYYQNKIYIFQLDNNNNKDFTVENLSKFIAKCLGIKGDLILATLENIILTDYINLIDFIFMNPEKYSKLKVFNLNDFNNIPSSPPIHLKKKESSGLNEKLKENIEFIEKAENFSFKENDESNQKENFTVKKYDLPFSKDINNNNNNLNENNKDPINYVVNNNKNEVVEKDSYPNSNYLNNKKSIPHLNLDFTKSQNASFNTIYTSNRFREIQENTNKKLFNSTNHTPQISPNRYNNKKDEFKNNNNNSNKNFFKENKKINIYNNNNLMKKNPSMNQKINHSLMNTSNSSTLSKDSSKKILNQKNSSANNINFNNENSKFFNRNIGGGNYMNNIPKDYTKKIKNENIYKLYNKTSSELNINSNKNFDQNYKSNLNDNYQQQEQINTEIDNNNNNINNNNFFINNNRYNTHPNKNEDINNNINNYHINNINNNITDSSIDDIDDINFNKNITSKINSLRGQLTSIGVDINDNN